MSPPSAGNEGAPGASGPSGATDSGWQPSHHKSIVTAARLISFTIICGLLFWGKVVAIPLALGVLFSFMLHPLVKRVQRIGLPRAPAVTITVLAACASVIALTWLIGSQLASLSHDLPKYQSNITAKVRQAREWVRGGAVEKIQDTMESVAQELDTDRAADAKSPASSGDSWLKPLPVT
jgi:predicted PurR-regulated permease PerM